MSVMTPKRTSLNAQARGEAVEASSTNLITLFLSVFTETHFEPGDYSAVKIKFKPSYDMKQVTTSIFNTGNIIITGAQTYKEIAYAYNLVVTTLHGYSGGRVLCAPYEEIVKFDTKFLGYRIDDMLPILRRQGHKSWCLTTNNRQINFSH